ncbi:6-phosphogluconate dehydrogenase C-terminal domain-like protein [Boletus edulis BED1]|uniref:6-phosphogluconate dehydrogenase C-terminal domain-like protein n=1 Tax=Boletus edulis BED1 TaxID=1328754 RepID=A0AAD4BXL5_BOLED|nr:6-phosphogluconate dehydrogenase C-terminal domain-like protein [Boletus edulis BED1]
MVTPVLPQFAVIAAGEMGSAVAKRLTGASCTVYTNLDGRSEATRQRAREAGMLDATLDDIVVKVNWILSILPPRDAVSFAEKIRDAVANRGKQAQDEPLVFADCNAVSPQTVKRIAGILAGTGIRFIDAGIIGGPPRDGYDPSFYASTAAEDRDVLDDFVALSKYGLKVSPLTGEGAGVGDASALKMSYAGISKGTTGLYTTMILAAYASSPATAEALLKELSLSQAGVLARLVESVPRMIPKAYRWVREMEEIGEFVSGKEGDTYRGLARMYERVENSLDGDQADVEVLKKFVDDAKKTVRHAPVEM